MCTAYYDHVQRHGAPAVTPQPATPLVFETLSVIYLAAHPAAATPWEAIGHPHASLYLYHVYFTLHPALRAAALAWCLQALVQYSDVLALNTFKF